MALIKGKNKAKITAAILLVVSFLFFGNKSASALLNSYNKPWNGTLSATEWNNLPLDFLNKEGAATLMGPLTIGSAATSSSLYVYGGILSPINSAYISSGEFGSLVGYGNYYFGASGAGNVGIGTTTASHKLTVQGDINFTGSLLNNGTPFTGSRWSLNGTSIYYNTGNVGIGTTNPAYKLDVNGDIGIKHGSKIQDVGMGGTFIDFDNSLTLDANDDVILGSNQLVVKNTGNVGIGLTNPSAKLHISGASGLINSGSTQLTALAGAGDVFVMADNAGNIFSSSTSAIITPIVTPIITTAGGWTASGTLVYKTDPNGNVGIGTTNPSEILHISKNYSANTAAYLNISADRFGGNNLPIGGIKFKNAASAYEIAKIETTNGPAGEADAGVLSFFTRPAGGSVTQRMVITNTGNVGIGTTTPQAKLDVNGNMLVGSSITSLGALGATAQIVTSSNGSNLILATSDNGNSTGGLDFQYDSGKSGLRRIARIGAVTQSGGGGDLIFQTAPSATGAYDTKMILNRDGNVGIGNTAPGTKLDITGTFRNSLATTHTLLGGSGNVLVMADNTGTLYSTANPTGTALLPSGTSGYTLRHDGAAWVSNSNVFNNGTNVGIGTTNPGVKLDVNGNFRANVAANRYFIMRSNSGSEFVIAATTTDAAWLQFQNTGDVYSIGVDTNDGALKFKSGWYGGTNERMRLTSAGNMGIGTTNPLFKLNIVGSQSLDQFSDDANSSVMSFRKARGTTSAPIDVAHGDVLGEIDVRGYNDSAGSYNDSSKIQFLTSYPNSSTDTTDMSGIIAFLTSSDGYAAPVERMRINDSGNVGIGTTAPGTKLDVTGTFRNSLATTHSSLGGAGNVLVMADNTGTLYSAANPVGTALLPTGTSGYTLRHDGTAWVSNSNVFNNGTNVGIGTTNPGQLLEISKSASGAIGPILNLVNPTSATSSAVEMRFAPSSSYASRYASIQGINRDGQNTIELAFLTGAGASITEKMRINSSGNIGIGTTAPGTKLDITGTFRNSLATTHSSLGGAGNVLVMADNTGTLYSAANPVGTALLPTGTSGYTLRHDGTAWVSNSNIFNSGTNVGIGTANPHGKLEINGGNIQLYNYGADNQTNTVIASINAQIKDRIEAAGMARINFLTDTPYYKGAISFLTNDSDGTNQATPPTEKMRITPAGNVGIGTAAPAERLDLGFTTSQGGNMRLSTYGYWGSLYSSNNQVIGYNAKANSGATSNVLVANTNGVVGYNYISLGYSGTNAITFHAQSGAVTAGAIASNERMRISGDGNVGIGTTAPGTKLDITGTFRNSLATTHSSLGGAGNVLVMADNTGTLYSAANPVGTALLPTGTSGYTLRHDGTAWVSNSNIFNSGTNVGIGTTNPGVALEVAAATDATLKVRSTGANANTYLYLIGRLAGVDKVSYIYSDWNGNIHFNPASGVFSVNTGAIQSSFNLNGNMSVGSTYVNSPAPANGAIIEGNVGIGITNPTAKLHVVGATGLINTGVTQFSALGGAGNVMVMADNAGTLYSSSTAAIITPIVTPIVTTAGGWTASGTTVYKTDTNGNVGIGMTNPAEKLDINGNIHVSAGNYIQFGTSGSHTLITDDSANGRTSIRARGNVLDVLLANGSAWGTVRAANLSGSSAASGNLTIDSTTSATKGSVLINPTGGNVGIGLTNPAAKLQITSGATPGIINSGSTQLSALGGAGNVLVMADNTGTLYSTANPTGTALLPTGTSGYTLRHDGTAWVSNSNIFNSGTSVGIGTTNPNSYRLNVAGRLMSTSSSLSVNSDSVAMEDATSNLLYRTGAGNLTNVSFSYGTKTYLGNGRYRFVNTSGGSALIRFNANLADLVDGGTYAISIGYENLSAGIVIDWCDRPTTGVTSATSGNGRLYGTASRSPYDSTYRFFDVQLAAGGSVDLYADQLEYKNYPTSFVPGDRAAGDLVLGGRLSSYSASSSYFSGNLGIGTTNPTSKLEIYSDNDAFVNLVGAINQNAGFSLYEGSSSSYGFKLFYEGISSNNFLIQSIPFGTTTPTTRLTIQRDSGNVGIGTTAPGTKLDITGTFRNSLATTHSSLGGAGNVLVMADNTGTLYSAANPVGTALLPTGTSGYTLRHDGTAWVSNSNIFNSGTNVGIGTTNPQAKLDINGNIQIPTSSQITMGTAWNTGSFVWYNGGSIMGTMAASALTWTGFKAGGGNPPWTPGYGFENAAGTGMGNVGTNMLAFYTSNAEQVRINNNGNVGIGLTNPTAKLHVVGATGLINTGATQLSALGGAGQVFVMADNTGTLYSTSTTAIVTPIVTSASGWTASGTTVYKTDINGNVGIGTTNPGDKLTVSNGTGEIRFGGGNGRTLSAYNAGSLANFDFNAVQTYFNSDFLIASGKKISTGNGSNANLYLTADGTGQIYTDKNVGIGLTNPAAKLQITAGATPGIINSGSTQLSALGGAGNVLVMADNTGTLYSVTSPEGTATLPTGTSGYTLRHNGTAWVSNSNIFNSGTNVGIGTTNPLEKLHIVGNVRISGTLSTQTGSDFAEEFVVTEEIEPGTVVVMADSGYKSVKASQKAYDQTVVGVVSNSPSIVAGQVNSNKKAIVAMVGVVDVKVVNSNGNIKRGDLLTTSNVAGYAMKTNNAVVGTIIGKALEDMDTKRGTVKALINLQ